MPKRSWFQFNLKTLFMSTVMVSVVLLMLSVLSVCVRISYLRRRVQFHDQEAMRCAQLGFEINAQHGSPKIDASPEELYGPEDGARSRELTEGFLRHVRLANEYHAAVFRPWTTVDENAAQSWVARNFRNNVPTSSAPAPKSPKP
jgi:hypothetical protein